jgi:hypothetical protein
MADHSDNNGNGRDPNTGRFVVGNTAGTGPKRVAAWRDAMAAAITPDDLQRLVRRMMEAGCNGDTSAARLIFERVWPATHKIDMSQDLPIRIIRLESISDPSPADE